MRILRWVSLLVFAGCTQPAIHQCKVDDDCDSDAICAEGHCIFDPLPRLRAVPSTDRARVGEVVTLELGESSLPVGSVEVRVEPEGAAEVLAPASDGSPRIRVIRPHTSLGVTLVARSPAGRKVSQSLAIGPRNSAPVVRLVAPESLQPGEEAEFRAEVSDPDGDAFAVEWEYVGHGTFSANGVLARLSLPPGEAESEHRLRVRADDGLDPGEATLAFRPGNRPPVIEGIVVPEAVEHHCGEFGCGAQVRLEAVVRDAGPLTYDWHFRAQGFSGTATFEGAGPNPLLILRTPPNEPIAGSYPVEVVVRDEEGAIATATTQVVVSNRPPRLAAHDGRPLLHVAVGEGRYLWYREPGTFPVWLDPDGDTPRPGSIRWSSPDPAVRILDPESLDPRIEIEGGPELLGQKIPISVEAEDVNGARAKVEAELEPGNHPPTVLGYSIVQRLAVEGVRSFQPFCFDVEDPDGDPLVVLELVVHPDNDPSWRENMAVVEDTWACGSRYEAELHAECPWFATCPPKKAIVRYVFRAEDALGAVTELELAVPWDTIFVTFP
nr:MAG: hypothetical protein DIU72_05785 [Pseudomonadota bacterium]